MAKKNLFLKFVSYNLEVDIRIMEICLFVLRIQRMSFRASFVHLSTRFFFWKNGFSLRKDRLKIKISHENLDCFLRFPTNCKAHFVPT